MPHSAAVSGRGGRCFHVHEPDGKAHEEVRDGGPEVARGDVEALLFVKLLVLDVPLLLFIGRGRVDSAMKGWRPVKPTRASSVTPPVKGCALQWPTDLGFLIVYLPASSAISNDLSEVVAAEGREGDAKGEGRSAFAAAMRG